MQRHQGVRNVDDLDVQAIPPFVQLENGIQSCEFSSFPICRREFAFGRKTSDDPRPELGGKPRLWR